MIKFLPKPHWLKVHLSNRYLNAQVVRKEDAHIIATASSKEREVRSALPDTATFDEAACGIVGKLLAERCQAQEIPQLDFELKPNQRYHGKLKVLLDTLIRNGIQVRW